MSNNNNNNDDVVVRKLLEASTFVMLQVNPQCLLSEEKAMFRKGLLSEPENGSFTMCIFPTRDRVFGCVFCLRR